MKIKIPVLFLMVGAAVPRRLAFAAQQQLFLRDATKSTRGCDRFAARRRRQRQLRSGLRLGFHTGCHLSREAPTLGLVVWPEEMV